jgi:hypothetical protein
MTVQIRKKVDDRPQSGQLRLLVCDWTPDGPVSPENPKINFTAGFSKTGYFMYDCRLYTGPESYNFHKVYIPKQEDGEIIAIKGATRKIYGFEKPFEHDDSCIKSQWLIGKKGQWQNRLSESFDDEYGGHSVWPRICESASLDTTKAIYPYNTTHVEMHPVPLEMHVDNMLQKAAIPSFATNITEPFSASIQELTSAATKNLDYVEGSYFLRPSSHCQHRKQLSAGNEQHAGQQIVLKENNFEKVLFLQKELEFVQNVFANMYPTIDAMATVYQFSR